MTETEEKRAGQQMRVADAVTQALEAKNQARLHGAAALTVIIGFTIGIVVSISNSETRKLIAPLSDRVIENEARFQANLQSITNDMKRFETKQEGLIEGQQSQTKLLIRMAEKMGIND